MAEQNNKAPILPISGIMMLLAALGVVMFTQIPYKGERPSVSDTYEPSNKARARLWQDPFRAVLDHEITRKKNDPIKEGRTGFSEGYDQLADELSQIAPENLTVLGVMVFGGPYADDTEWRMRTRYAVLSGLGKEGYIPSDENHVGYITYDPERLLHLAAETENTSAIASSITASVPSLTLTNIVPYEWMAKTDNSSNKDDPKKVLVLWINDDVFQPAPLAKIVVLLDNINKPVPRTHKIGTFKVIGPAGTTNLVGLIEDSKQPIRRVARSGSYYTIKIYSGVATADLKQMYSTEEDKYLLQPIFPLSYGTNTVLVERTIGTDQELAKKIVDELCLRDINSDQPECSGGSSEKIRKHKDHIVLISEWDTYYGRSLPWVFKEAFHDNNVIKSYDQDEKHEWVHKYSYMRGIDGMVPGEKTQDVSGETGKNARGSSQKSDLELMEQPTGKSQLDYLRRLAARIKQYDARLKADDTNGIRAIGILGSDFYDKYMALQAMRQQFPDAVFFTTDLDARLLQPDNLKWTRNLLVASHYNLQLKRDLQDEIPPFRDTYQTSVYLTILRLFEKDKYGEFKKSHAPRVYEIGRGRPYPLSRNQTTVNANVAESSGVPHVTGLIWKLPLLVLTAVVLLCRSSLTIRRTLKEITVYAAKRKRNVAIAFGSLLLYLLWFYFDIYRNPREEQFLLESGISIWPTEILRIIAAICSVVLTSRAFTLLDDNSGNLGREFGLTPAKDDETANNNKFKWENIGAMYRKITTDYKAMSLGTFSDLEKNYSGKIDDLWKEYTARGTSHTRNKRTLIYVVLYALFAFALMSMMGFPYNAIRGTRSLWMDKIALGLSVSTFLYLTFLVVDATRLCKTFIHIASIKSPQWIENSYLLLIGKKENESKAENDDLAKTLRKDTVRDALNGWMLIRLIAERTEAVTKLVFYPFIILFIMIISRASIFERWSTPWDLAVIIILTAVYAWSCAFMLRRAAEKARTIVLDRLSKMMAKAAALEGEISDSSKWIKHFIDEITNERRGAFASFAHQPIVQTLLVPFGGAGSVVLLEFLEKMNI